MVSLLDISQVVEKAAEVAQRDPKGLIISLVAISVVFLSLFILHYCYRFVGWISTHKKIAQPTKGGEKEEEIAAAISLALAMENGSDETQAAIALALDRYLSESIHDKESYIITIKRKY